ncbi:MAG: hypothetical protein GYB64_11440 [Chloroflexi bacterium]|nr:hypothetical protein [Chloroflexota bacterium]
MEEVYPRVRLVYPESKFTTGQPFTYLLERPAGNLLLANFSGGVDITPMFDAIEALGGVSLQLVTDRRAASEMNNHVFERFGAPVICSEIEAVALRAQGIKVGDDFAYEEVSIADDLEAFPTPGLTPGGVCYLWHSDMSEYMFVGEIVFPAGSDAWHTPTDLDNLDDLFESLEVLQEMEFHVMVGSSPQATEVPVFDLNAGKRWNIFEKAMEFLEDQ